MCEHLLAANEAVLQRMQEQQSTQPTDVVTENWEKGDLAWLLDPAQANKVGSRKLANPWTGPFMVLETHPEQRNVTLLQPSRNEPRRASRVTVDRLRRYMAPIQQLWLKPGDQYKFPLTLLSSRTNRDHKLEYKVRWLSLTEQPDSWVEAELLPRNLLDTFRTRQEEVKLVDSAVV